MPERAMSCSAPQTDRRRGRATKVPGWRRPADGPAAALESQHLLLPWWYANFCIAILQAGRLQAVNSCAEQLLAD